MPALDLRVLVLERQRLRIQQDLDIAEGEIDVIQGSLGGGVVSGSGLTNRVALWGTATALTADNELFYNSVDNRLGVGTATPAATLTVNGTSHLAGATDVYGNLYVTGPIGQGTAPVGGYSFYGLSAGYFGGRVTGNVGFSCPNYPGDYASGFYCAVMQAGGVGRYQLNLGGDAPSYFGGSLQVIGNTSLSGTLYVAGTTTLGRTGIAYVPDPAYWLRSGSAYIDSILTGGMTVSGGLTVSGAVVAGSFGYNSNPPRWPLDIAGQGFVSQLGVWYGPTTAATDGVDLRVRYTRIDALGCGRSPDSGYALVTNGVNYFGGATTCTTTLQVASWAGFGYAPTEGLYIKAGNSQFDAAGFGYAGGSGYNLRAGSIAVDSAYCVGGLRVDGNADLRGAYTGIGGWANASWTLTVTGTSYFTGSAQFVSEVGMGGQPPVVGISLRSTNAYIDYIGAQGGIDTRFCIRMYTSIYLDGTPYNASGGSWVAYSDARLKRIHGEIAHPLETMCALHGLLYEYTDTLDGKPPGVRMGVLAQEVEAVIPEWVGELSGYKTTQLSAFEALAIESIKALTARVAVLEDAVGA